MSAPSLRNTSLAPHLVAALPHSVRSSVSVFRVVRDGLFAGREFRAGELAIVEGAPEDGDPVVLVAMGPGRPRLGRVEGNRLLGDLGEPCLLSRWEVAGRVSGVIRPVGAGWAVELFDQPGVIGMAADPAVSGSVPTREAPPAVAQLSLFAA